MIGQTQQVFSNDVSALFSNSSNVDPKKDGFKATVKRFFKDIPEKRHHLHSQTVLSRISLL
jgi:hypothetical protein